jgi:hypothetical protein
MWGRIGWFEEPGVATKAGWRIGLTKLEAGEMGDMIPAAEGLLEVFGEDSAVVVVGLSTADRSKLSWGRRI